MKKLVTTRPKHFVHTHTHNSDKTRKQKAVLSTNDVHMGVVIEVAPHVIRNEPSVARNKFVPLCYTLCQCHSLPVRTSLTSGC